MPDWAFRWSNATGDWTKYQVDERIKKPFLCSLRVYGPWRPYCIRLMNLWLNKKVNNRVKKQWRTYGTYRVYKTIQMNMNAVVYDNGVLLNLFLQSLGSKSSLTQPVGKLLSSLHRCDLRGINLSLLHPQRHLFWNAFKNSSHFSTA